LRRAKNIADPFAYSTYRAKRIEEKMEAERKSRITVRAKLPKVNALAAARFIQQDGGVMDVDGDGEERSGKKRRTAANPMADERFKVR
jgi:ribosome biogenesis protein ENP2